MSEAPVLFERRGGAAIVTLNRPQALNALNLPMLRLIRAQLLAWRSDPSVAVVILRGEGRSFCAGGDIKGVLADRDDDVFLDEVYRVEYEVDALIHGFGRPVIALLHGNTMGGGCGLSLHASHPVAAENLALAMPETAIGFFPDIASGAFLSRCPHHIGLFMALTGARIGAEDAVRMSLVKAIVPQHRHGDLIAAIADGDAADDVVRRLAVPVAPGLALDHVADIARVFHGASAAAVMSRLQTETSAWAREVLRTLRDQAPFSLEVAASVFARSRGKSVAELLAIDFRVAQHMTRRQDYAEGVRCRLIERGAVPEWSPARIEDVDAAEVERCFAPIPKKELWSVGQIV